jgi:tRNA pseudouridine55 synthase
VRKLYRTRRVGHTGTLDPIASGLMLVLIGRATKIAPYITALSKRYLATVRLGATSDTGDVTGNLTVTGDATAITTEQIRETLSCFVGEMAQRIPAYSAVRSGGRRLYELARKGEDVPDLERTVIIHSAELISHEGNSAGIRIECSSGTYIRSLAEALGEALGCGAHLSGLRREAVGRWQVEDAWTLETLDEKKRQGELPPPDPIAEYLDYATIQVEADSLESVIHGTPLTPTDIASIEGQFAQGDLILVVHSVHDVHPLHEVVAIATALVDSNNRPDWPANEPVLRYRRVLAQ